jgi:putative transposase
VDWRSPWNEHPRLGHEAADQRSADPRLFRVATSRDHFREARKCLHWVWALRGERFRQQIEALGQRRAASKGVGRPRKGEYRASPPSDPVRFRIR